MTYPRPSVWKAFGRIVRDEGGFAALFRGALAGTYLWIGYSAVQFVTYGRIRHFLEDSMDAENPRPTMVAFSSGAIAGVCATVTTYPFDFCRTVFAAQGLPPLHSFGEPGFRPPRSLRRFALRLYKDKGLTAFYVGGWPAVIQIVPYMGLNFAIYDFLTQDKRNITLSGYAGILSGSISKAIVYPMDTVKKRTQAQAVFGIEGGSKYTGVIDCFVKIVEREGPRSLYKGVLLSVLKTGIASGLSFSLFRGTMNVLESVHDGRRVSSS